MTLALLGTQSFALVCIIIAARAGLGKSAAVNSNTNSNRSNRAIALPSGCLYEGRRYDQGAIIASREVCLRCSCFHGALACRRRSCAPLPDPTPQKCHVIHKEGSCCPELHCPDGVISMESTGVGRLEDDLSDVATPASIANVCVEGGTVFAAGSAMTSSVACEQCFCLGATRKCVRPQCLPPPPGCKPRPELGACCPQKYHCEHTNTTPSVERRHDCEVNGKWVSEGERVLSAENSSDCTQCFCLHGVVRCQPLLCAPPLLGCKPLLHPGECCAHQYHCQHQGGSFIDQFQPIFNNALLSTSNKHRTFHSPKNQKFESTTKNITTKKSNLPISDNHLVPTTKVKRKTNDASPSSTQKPINVTSTTLHSVTNLASDTTLKETAEKTTEQPEGTVKIMINGTINCTTEISSETIPINKTQNETDMIKMDVQPRKPIINIDNLDDHTFSPNDIITDKNINGFDDTEIYTINVTSSLSTNTSRSTRPPMVTVSKIVLPTDLAEALNASKKTKGDYDYDYTEPTLPPSLPNLKIIPFVAADAVVDDESEKDTMTYPMLEREDKFPVYYPSTDTKRTPYETRKSDVYNPTQYPIFISNKESEYPSLTNEETLPISEHPYNLEDLEYSVSTSLGNRISEINKIVTNSPAASSTFEMETPAVNLFSPPVETEGGFVPKAPELIDDYYSVYPSTPPATSVPHLTTSMQLDIAKGECLSSDGRHIPEGESINFACSECTCAWGELHCSPRSCHTPTGCRRRPASSAADLCCGELICDEDNKSTLRPLTTTDIKLNNDTKVRIENISLTIKVDTPPERNFSSNNSNQTKLHIKNNIGNDLNKKNNAQAVTATLSKTITNASTVISMTTTTKTPQQAKENKVVIPPDQTNHTLNTSQEYEDDEDDEGFSFGSVLKLLLSDSYETTTSVNQKMTTTRALAKSTFKTTSRKPSKQTIKPFIPLPPRPYIPPNQIQTSVSRIDHLVLGEATAIHSTVRPTTTKSSTAYTQKLSIRPLEITNKESQSGQYTSVTHEGPRPPSLGGLAAGLLKLAGCNIYGRMYRVGRIITELSTPCQECWCTELGVQCKPLEC